MASYYFRATIADVGTRKEEREAQHDTEKKTLEGKCRQNLFGMIKHLDDKNDYKYKI